MADASENTVLIVDDDPSLLDMLAMTLEDEGCGVRTATNGKEGLEQIESGGIDVAICDINMPKLDGFAMLRELRDEGYQLPIVMLTSRDSEIDEALGLELGADDYVSKPFNDRVLVARIEALLRRAETSQEDDEETTEIGELVLYTDRLSVEYHDEEIDVTVTEFRLLEALTNRPGMVYSRDQLLDRMRPDDSFVADRIVDTYVRRLRRKLEEIDADFDAIETVVGAGYKWSG
jgi:DNA-binding response OmpR family regulator